jgi:hypothetical protein
VGDAVEVGEAVGVDVGVDVSSGVGVCVRDGGGLGRRDGGAEVVGTAARVDTVRETDAGGPAGSLSTRRDATHEPANHKTNSEKTTRGTISLLSIRFYLISGITAGLRAKIVCPNVKCKVHQQ